MHKNLVSLISMSWKGSLTTAGGPAKKRDTNQDKNFVLSTELTKSFIGANRGITGFVWFSGKLLLKKW